ncbi:hypothetical protein M3664_04715 [Paenibacillus lautus]|uniref:hypothetical protein n=1 Tax=Paenibacillus lautus TaxID=1401 RepID=UPI00203FB573|nr:hypothetical protein [Paenibacillus lautus]MCM3257084.1 hypothetical protein [Paenibacillus lautus]
MDDFLSVVEKFEGIIGALLGVMMTLILTEVFKRIGNIKFYTKFLDVVYEVRDVDSWGQTTNRKAVKDEANFLRVELTLEVYNSSDTPKILRDVNLVFYNGKRKILSVEPEDKSTERFAAASFHRDKFGFTNIKPKEIISINLVYNCYDQKILDQIKRSNKVYLESRDYKNKIVGVILTDL